MVVNINNLYLLTLCKQELNLIFVEIHRDNKAQDLYIGPQSNSLLPVDYVSQTRNKLCYESSFFGLQHHICTILSIKNKCFPINERSKNRFTNVNKISLKSTCEISNAGTQSSF